jgi:hypothetical protein
MPGLAVMLGAFASAALWMSVLAPSIARLFGVPLAFGFGGLGRKNQHLTKLQFVWGYGTFTWGIGMFLCFTMWDFLDWKLLADQSSGANLRPERIGARLLLMLIGGAILGFWSAPDKHIRRSRRF